jgi:hypothetical protein
MCLSGALLNKGVIKYLLSHDSAFGVLYITAHWSRSIDVAFRTSCSPQRRRKNWIKESTFLGRWVADMFIRNKTKGISHSLMK